MTAFKLCSSKQVAFLGVSPLGSVRSGRLPLRRKLQCRPLDQPSISRGKRVRLHLVNCSDSRQGSPEDREFDSKSAKQSFSFRSIRKLLAGLSILGALETGYLTYIKVLSSPGAICSTQGCVDVLTGPFSSFLGIPLTLFALLAYSAFAYLSVWPLTAEEEEVEISGENSTEVRSATEVYEARDAATRPLLLALSTSMFLFSGYLMGILVFIIRSMCPYCVFSATLSTLLFVLTAFLGKAVPNWKPALSIGIGSSAVTALGAAVLFSTSMPIQMSMQVSGIQSPPEITLSSDKASIKTAGNLALKKTKMYGAFWCTHCYNQKQIFGKEAFSLIPYIECDKNGAKSQYKLCREKRIPGYPTWEIAGKLYPGEIEISELERLADEAEVK